MINVILALFAAFMLSVTALDKDLFLRELKEKHHIEVLDKMQEEEEINNFKNLDRVQQLLEIKRRLMQTLGGVNDAYRELGISSLEVKTEILSILRKVQNIPQDAQQAKSVFKNVYQNLDQLIQFIPQDASAKISQKPQSVKPSGQWPTSEWEQEEGYWQGNVHGGGQGGGHGGGQGGQNAWAPQGSWQGQEQKPGKNPFEGSIVVPEPEIHEGLLTYLLYPICGILKLTKHLVLCLFAL